jgi:hypothetical protein
MAHESCAEDLARQTARQSHPSYFGGTVQIEDSKRFLGTATKVRSLIVDNLSASKVRFDLWAMTRQLYLTGARDS